MISYIVITYNRCCILSRCIDSLLGVIEADDEVIVVDNGSTDETSRQLAEYSDRINVIRSEQNLGVAGGRNLGISQARGDITVFLDDDAFFTTAGVSGKISSLFAENPRAAGLAFTIIDGNTGREQYSSVPGDKRAVWDKPSRCSYFCGAGFAVRRSVFKRVGMFWEFLFYGGEELDFGYRVVRDGSYFLFIDDVVVRHESTPVARPSGQWLYFQARNRPLIALRNLPIFHTLSHTALWWAFLCIQAVKAQGLRHLAAGIRDAIRNLPAAFRLRKSMRHADLKLLAGFRGRVYY